MNKLMPRQPVPDLIVKTLAGSTWNLRDVSPEHFTMIVFYRGYHCPVCRTYVPELDRLVEEFAEKGVEIMVLSSDTEERAEQTRKDWKLERLNLGYGVEIEAARQWGLYVSSSRGKTSIGVEEPGLFGEPGVFLVRPDNTLYWAAVQSMPFARPHFKEMLAAMDFIIKNDYPARGEA